MTDLLQLLVSSLGQGSIYALMALGLTLIYRSTTVLNFGHAAFFTIGAFVALTLVDDHVPYLLAIVATLVIVAIVAILIDKVAFEPLLGSDHVAQVFATVAVLYIVRGVVRYFSIDQRFMPPTLGTLYWHVGGAIVSPQYVLVFGVLVMAAAFFAWTFTRTHTGRIIRASSLSSRGAALIGINVRSVFMWMWVVGALLGAIAGILAAPTLLVSADVGDRPLLEGFAAMTLGGFGTFPGAIVGGLVVGVIGTFSNRYISSTLGDLSAYLVILGVLLLKPRGIFGSSEVD